MEDQPKYRVTKIEYRWKAVLENCYWAVHFNHPKLKDDGGYGFLGKDELEVYQRATEFLRKYTR